MPDQPFFEYVDAVRIAINAARARRPPLQDTAIAEYGRMISDEVTRGEWVQDNGDVLNSEGLSIEQDLNFKLTTRPHWLVPAEAVDQAEACWLGENGGSLTAQSQRWKALRAILGNDAATNGAMKAEAEMYSATFGKPGAGRKPGHKSAKDEDTTAKGGGPNNPWSIQFRGTEAERDARIASIIKGRGTAFAQSLAKAAGTTIGKPLRK